MNEIADTFANPARPKVSGLCYSRFSHWCIPADSTWCVPFTRQILSTLLLSLRWHRADWFATASHHEALWALDREASDFCDAETQQGFESLCKSGSTGEELHEEKCLDVPQRRLGDVSELWTSQWEFGQEGPWWSEESGRRKRRPFSLGICF